MQKYAKLQSAARPALFGGEAAGVKKKKKNRRSKHGGQTQMERRHGKRGEGGGD